MRTNLSILLICLLVSFGAFAQHNTSELPTSISETGTPPDNSAILDLQSSNKGLLIPRMTYVEIKAIPSPAEGLMAYDTDNHCLRIFNGSKWDCLYQRKNGSFGGDLTIQLDGGSSSDVGREIAVDASGNIYVVGEFSDTATFGNISVTSAGSSDVFVAKYDSNGVNQWVRTTGGSDSDYGHAIAVSASGDVYVTGSFYGGASCSGTGINSTGGSDIFVAKYDTAGNLIWVQTSGGTSGDSGRSIAVDASDNIYLTGLFTSTATFGTTPVTSAGSYDIFIAKYNSAGTLQWVESAGGTSADIGYSIALDTNGNIYTTGEFAGTATFGSTTITSAGADDIYIAKHDASGVLSWVMRAGSVEDDRGYGITVDPMGFISITGHYDNVADFSGTSLPLIDRRDIFIARYDNSGSLVWVKSVGGEYYDIGYAIASDSDGNVYLTGRVHGVSFFDQVQLEANQEIFVAKCNVNGAVEWAELGGGGAGDDGRGIAVDVNGNIYVTGSTGTFSVFGETHVIGNGGSDMFIAKYSQ